jgi:hypothetical protein
LSAREAREVGERVAAWLQQAVSCVSEAVLIRGRGRVAPDRGQSLTLGGDAVRLRGTSRLALTVVLDFAFAQSDRWEARLVGYSHEILYADGPMLLAYHWHPVGLSHVTTPHLHLGGSLAGIDLSKAHLPTGVVPLQEILRFAIVDLGVEPLRGDWRAVLAAP